MTKSKWNVPIFLIFSLLTFIGFILVAYMIKGPWIASFDSTIISWIQGLEAPWLTSVMHVFTYIGSTPAVIVIFLISLFIQVKFLHHRKEIIVFLIGLLGTVGWNQLLKIIYQRERPSLHRLIEETGYSFPSGHSMAAFALYASLAFLLWRHLPTKTGRTLVILSSICMILLIGISRIYLGVHYPSDVIGAYFASGCWFTFIIWIFQWYMENRYNKHKAS